MPNPRWPLDRTLLAALVICAFTALPTVSVAQSPAGDTRLAIDFQATNLDGTPFDAADLAGRAVLLDFWAVWCRPCLEAFPTLNALAARLAAYEVEILGLAVHSGSAAEVAAALDEYDVDYRFVVPDEALVYRLEVIGFPTYLLVAPDGTMLHATCRGAAGSE